MTFRRWYIIMIDRYIWGRFDDQENRQRRIYTGPEISRYPYPALAKWIDMSWLEVDHDRMSSRYSGKDDGRLGDVFCQDEKGISTDMKVHLRWRVWCTCSDTLVDRCRVALSAERIVREHVCTHCHLKNGLDSKNRNTLLIDTRARSVWRMSRPTRNTITP